MKTSKKALSLLLALLMLASCFALTAAATTTLYSISVNNVSSPITGATIPSSVSASITNGVTIKESYWTKKIAGGAYTKTTDTTFKADGEYAVLFKITPASGYEFAKEGNMLAYVNGNTATYKNPAPNTYSISYAFGKPLTEIKSIAVTNVTLPTLGAAIPSTVSATLSGGVVAVNTYWTRKDAGGNFSKTSDTKFQVGGEYGVYLTVQPKDGYAISNSVGATVNGYKASIVKNSDTNYAITFHFDAVPSALKTITVTGVSTPTAGAAISTSGIKASEGFNISDMYWTKKQSDSGIFSKTTDTSFQGGGEYGFYVSGRIADGYTASDSVTATIGGKAATVSKNGPNYGLTVHFDALPKLTEVTSIAITGLSSPSVGSTVSTSGIKASAGFTITDSYWTKKQSGSGIYAKTTDTTFQNGGEYGLYVSGKLASGYTASNLPTATFGSKSMTVQKNGTNYGLSVRFDALKQNLLVTFNTNGGTLPDAQKSKIVVVGDTYGSLPTPTKEGYTFTGWYVAWNGSDKLVDSSTKVEKTTNHELSAHWSKDVVIAKHVDVTFDAKGGMIAMAEKVKTVYVGLAYGQLPVPYQDGYTFEGWYNSADEQITAASIVTETTDHTLTAKYAKAVAKTVTVTFDATPGFVTPTKKTVTVGEKYGELPIASRGGYKFLGWFDDTDTQINSLSIVNKSSDHTLKAKFESTAANVTVTFDANGGSVTPTSITAEPGKLYGTLPTPTKEGNTFIGWYTKDGVKITEDTVVPFSVDHTLTAKWAENSSKPVTVTLDPAEGNVEGGNKTLEPGKPFGELPTPTKPGYVFLGWYDKDGNKINETDLVPSGNFTLIAKWEAETAPHTEHTYDDGKVTKEATCIATGEKVFTCTVCGKTKTEVIPMAAHTYTDAVPTKQATCTSTGEQSFTCSVCGGSYVETLPKTEHSFTTTKVVATLKKSGEINVTCVVCGETQRVSVIYRPKTFALAKTKYTYNGKAKTPSVTVKDAMGEVIPASNYKVKYYNNKDVGTAKVKIVFKGDYSGSKVLKFQILPKKTAIKNVKAASKAFKLSWKALKSGDGYQIQYATNKGFTKNAKLVTIKDETVTARTIKKLKAKTTYYVRVRTLQAVDGKYYSSAWSDVKKVKTK